jgi:flagellar basal-body rod modification protein FlgD
MATIQPSVTSAVTAATTTPSSSSTTAASTGIDKNTLAGNFTTFLTLLTTQLKNQNPMDPLDTNQFTQQLVQFAGVEQQLKANAELTSLVAMQKSAQATQALAFVGTTVAVDGTSTQLASGKANWSFKLDQPAAATVSITNSTGQTVYTGTFNAQTGTQNFAWDGRGNDGHQWPDGTYNMTVTAKDANGATVGVSTEVNGVVDSVDLTKNPPVLSVGGQTFTVDKVKRVTKSANQANSPPSGVNLSA